MMRCVLFHPGLSGLQNSLHLPAAPCVSFSLSVCLLVYVCVCQSDVINRLRLLHKDQKRMRMSFWCCYRCDPRLDDKFTTSQTNIKQRLCNYSSYLSKTSSVMTGCVVINWLYPAWMSKVQILLRWFTVLMLVLLLECHCNKAFNKHLPCSWPPFFIG